MKRFFTLALYCLWLVTVYGQMPLETEKKVMEANGIYLFEKAELIIRNDKTREIVDDKIIKDIATIDSYDIHQENIFLKIELLDGYLKQFMLPDKHQYIIDDMMLLQKEKGDKKELKLEDGEDAAKSMYEGKTLPPYSLQFQEGKLKVSISKYLFGQSDYNFTLEAELIITLTKQNDDETDSI